MYENDIIFSVNENVMHHFLKSKILLISLNFAFSSVQTVYVFIIKYIVPVEDIPSTSNLFPNIEQRSLFDMIPNMNRFVNRLLKNWTMLRTFQMPLVLCEICKQLNNQDTPFEY